MFYKTKKTGSNPKTINRFVMWKHKDVFCHLFMETGIDHVIKRKEEDEIFNASLHQLLNYAKQHKLHDLRRNLWSIICRFDSFEDQCQQLVIPPLFSDQHFLLLTALQLIARPHLFHETVEPVSFSRPRPLL